MHPTHPCGPPAFWQTPGPDWKICARRGPSLAWSGKIYMALVGVHTVCATLAKFSFGVSDSFEVKCIRWGQMGSPIGIRRVSSKFCGTPRQPNCPPLYLKPWKHATQVVSVQRSWRDECFPGFDKNKNKWLLISERRKAGLILQALL